MKQLTIFFMVTGLIFGSQARCFSQKDKSGYFLPKVSPEEVGINSQKLVEMYERIDQDSIFLHSLIIIRHDKIALESYFYPYQRDDIHNVKSITKSFLSALTGIAIEEGKIENVEKEVWRLLPEYAQCFDDSLKKRIAIKHLLSMTSGLNLDPYGEGFNDLDSDDFIQWTFNHPMKTNPGNDFCYNNGLPQALSAIITKQSGMSLKDYAAQKLFEPLHIKNAQWDKGPKGYYVGGSELFLRPIDMARFGYLYLNDGFFDGQQLVPESWVDVSTQNQIGGFQMIDGAKYGYYWIIGDDEWIVTNGSGGQTIFTNKKYNLIVAITAAEGMRQFHLFAEYILPSLKDNVLPENVNSNKRLNQLLKEAADFSGSSKESFAIANEISGKKIKLTDCPLHFETIALDFGDDSSIQFEKPDTIYTFPISQNNEFVISQTQNSYVPIEKIIHFPFNMGWMNFSKEEPGIIKNALRGYWKNDETFFLEYHEMGSPFHFFYEFIFTEEQVKIYYSEHPTMQERMVINGYLK